jgi:hypothetical protein
MRNPDCQKSKIEGSEEIRREKSPGWPPGKKPGAKKVQDNGPGRNPEAREAKKTAIQER